MYYEAKMVNTQLIYRYKQLEKAKETLEAAWLAHERLHQAAGLDVSDDDVYSSSVYQPTGVRDLSFSHQSASPVRSPHTDDAVLPGCPGSPSLTTRQRSAVSDDVHCRDPSWLTSPRQGRVKDFNSAASNRTNDGEFADCGNDGRKMKHDSDDPTGIHHLTYPSQSLSSVLCYNDDDVSGHSDVVESAESSVFDADQRSTLRANSDDDDGLDSLFGGDDWWVSDESWRWQCGRPASAAEETSPTATESAKSNGCSPSRLRLNDAASASSNFRHHDQFIPLHVEALVDDSSYHQQEISDI